MNQIWLLTLFKLNIICFRGYWSNDTLRLTRTEKMQSPDFVWFAITPVSSVEQRGSKKIHNYSLLQYLNLMVDWFLNFRFVTALELRWYLIIFISLFFRLCDNSCYKSYVSIFRGLQYAIKITPSCVLDITNLQKMIHSVFSTPRWIPVVMHYPHPSPSSSSTPIPAHPHPSPSKSSRVKDSL